MGWAYNNISYGGNSGAYLTRTYPIIPTYRNYPALLRKYPI
jgi:hypothetical protein